MKKYAITYGMKIVDYANSREEAQQMVKQLKEHLSYQVSMLF